VTDRRSSARSGRKEGPKQVRNRSSGKQCGGTRKKGNPRRKERGSREGQAGGQKNVVNLESEGVLTNKNSRILINTGLCRETRKGEVIFCKVGYLGTNPTEKSNRPENMEMVGNPRDQGNEDEEVKLLRESFRWQEKQERGRSRSDAGRKSFQTR